MRVFRTSARFVAVGLAAVFSPSLSLADQGSDTDFFRGKTITYIVGEKPDSNYSTYARLIGKYLEKHLPGTDVVLRHVPGASSLIATNKLYHAEPDGLTIGAFNTGMIYAQLFGFEGVRFDLREMSWIGKAAQDPRTIVVARNSGFESIDALIQSARPPILAGDTRNSGQFLEFSALAALIDLDGRMVANFSGSERRLGLIKGDFDLTFGTYSAFRNLVDEDHAFYALQFGARADGPGAAIPAAEDYVTTPVDRRVLDLMETVAFLGRMTASPPGVPEDRLSVLRKAYMDALKDPGLLEEARRLHITIQPADGATVADYVDRVLNPDPVSFQRFADVTGRAATTLNLRVLLLGVKIQESTVTFEGKAGDPLSYPTAAGADIFLNGAEAGVAELRPGDTCGVTLRIDRPIEIAALACAR